METKVLYWRNPTNEEIRFGHGTIHFREFEKVRCLDKDNQLHLSIISNDDNRRYYSVNHEFFITKSYKPVRVDAD